MRDNFLGKEEKENCCGKEKTAAHRLMVNSTQALNGISAILVRLGSQKLALSSPMLSPVERSRCLSSRSAQVVPLPTIWIRVKLAFVGLSLVTEEVGS